MNLRKLLLVVLDIVLINVAYFLGFMLKFDWDIPLYYFSMYKKWILPIVVIKILIYYLFGLYKIMWRYADFRQLSKVVMTTIFSNFVVYLLLKYMKIGFPRSIIAIVTLMDMFLITATR